MIPQFAAIDGISDPSHVRVALLINGRFVHAPLQQVLQTLLGSPLDLTSGQIAFPATQRPSSNPNTLDDYEEGTWTPTIQFGGASAGMTYSTRTGTYTKVGNLVFVEFSVILTAKGSSTGDASVAGLPFTPSGVSTGNARYIAMAGITSHPVFLETLRSTTMQVKSGGSATTSSSITDANFTNTSNFRGALTYNV